MIIVAALVLVLFIWDHYYRKRRGKRVRVVNKVQVYPAVEKKIRGKKRMKF